MRGVELKIDGVKSKVDAVNSKVDAIIIEVQMIRVEAKDTMQKLIAIEKLLQRRWW